MLKTLKHSPIERQLGAFGPQVEYLGHADILRVKAARERQLLAAKESE